MYDWLAAIARWLEIHVIGLPFYFAAPAMIIIGALDSSLLSLPEINDYLVVGRCFKYPTAAFYFPLFAATARRSCASAFRCRVLSESNTRMSALVFSLSAFPRYCLHHCHSKSSSRRRARSNIRAGSFC